MANTDYWDRRALLRLTDAEKTSIAYEKQIRKYYRKAEKDIEEMIENIYSNYAKDVGLDKQQLKMLLNAKESSDIWKRLKDKGLDQYVKANYKARITRLESIKAQLYEKSKELCRQEQKSLKTALKKVTEDTYYRTTYDTSRQVGIDCFSTLDDKTIETVINMKWHGGNYSSRVWNNTDALAAKLQDVMTRSVMTGASLAKARREIRDTFNTADYYAERLIRTEANHVHNEAEALAYQEMGVEEYVFVATLDNRTSEICQEHDQKRYKLSEKKVGENYPPMHPNCRSTVRAFIDEETEANMVRRARNPLTGKTETVGNMNYQQWKERHQNAGTWKDSDNNKFSTEANRNLIIEEKNKVFTDGTLSNKNGGIIHDAISYVDANGVIFSYQRGADPKKQLIEPDRAKTVFDSLPDKLRENVKEIDFVDYENPTVLQEKQAGILPPNAWSPAGTGNKVITFFRNDTKKKQVLDDGFLKRVYAHETAHILDESVIVGNSFSDSVEWKTAMQNDKISSSYESPTTYGTTDCAEDFAESIAEYVVNKADFITRFPNRATIIERLIKKYE